MEGVRAEKLKLGRPGVTRCYIIVPAASRSFRDPASPYPRVSSLVRVRAIAPTQSRHNKMYITLLSGSIKVGEIFG
jgi:hypothetical protein